MKKVILNKCYGGFSVSEEAYKLYAKKKGLKLYMYEADYSTRPIKYNKVKKSSTLFTLYRIKDFGKSFTRDIIRDDCDDFDKCGLRLDERYREDETLIEVVEELGEKANSVCSKLVIVEIPDEVAKDYVVDVYDGIETLHQRVEVW